MTSTTSGPGLPPPAEASVGELISRVSEQTTLLVRNELRLAQAELTQKGKKAGIGAGLFGGAGLFAAYGLGALVATAILALALVLSAWLSALIVAAALFVIAAVAALIGKSNVSKATPPVPREAVDGLKRDLNTLKSGGTS